MLPPGGSTRSVTLATDALSVPTLFELPSVPSLCGWSLVEHWPMVGSPCAAPAAPSLILCCGNTRPRLAKGGGLAIRIDAGESRGNAFHVAELQ